MTPVGLIITGKRVAIPVSSVTPPNECVAMAFFPFFFVRDLRWIFTSGTDAVLAL
jgi:hypothetical protein